MDNTVLGSFHEDLCSPTQPQIQEPSRGKKPTTTGTLIRGGDLCVDFDLESHEGHACHLQHTTDKVRLYKPNPDVQSGLVPGHARGKESTTRESQVRKILVTLASTQGGGLTSVLENDS